MKIQMILSERKLLGLLGQPSVFVYRMAPGSEIMGHSEFTSVVIGREGFDALMDEMLANPVSYVTPEKWRESVEAMRQLGNLSAAGRGAKTEWMFQKFGVTTQIMGVMVRGQGANVVAKLTGV